ncbi:MAG: SAM-dependent methyltransferase [Gammaproteobacteria bacterium]|jgi:SAM-dependent methyltransferase|uniref:class I SAM-dependent methyltransferase n=1 Tax=Pseudomonas sp. TaxID=306 RepID=UPI001D56E39D|nr:SAM-dependent methyltransferase [Gammaproteobacteria bacterium]MBU2156328.1 SAM-dependent methyltransferase [Gammaproteobacteria bacterium]MBU2256806.1 SAM-dependent methyltransferase [Gammaproteobacteria bacterium]MBU2293053.1 SAM-dependent methyltransferase [Gammaproteobacteria bacterium]
MSSHPHSTPQRPHIEVGKTPAGRMLSSIARRVTQWRAGQLINSALKLAGEPSLVLDLPCAADGLWPLLSTSDSRVVIAAEANAEQLTAALAGLHAVFSRRVHPLQTSLFAIDLGANAVDCIFSMYGLHHIDDPRRRMLVLREFNRVTRDCVIISVWVDGNLEAARQTPLTRRNGQLHARAQIEREFTDAGFHITGHRDFIPGLAMLRLYVLHKLS